MWCNKLLLLIFSSLLFETSTMQAASQTVTLIAKNHLITLSQKDGVNSISLQGHLVSLREPSFDVKIRPRVQEHQRAEVRALEKTCHSVGVFKFGTFLVVCGLAVSALRYQYKTTPMTLKVALACAIVVAAIAESYHSYRRDIWKIKAGKFYTLSANSLIDLISHTSVATTDFYDTQQVHGTFKKLIHYLIVKHSDPSNPKKTQTIFEGHHQQFNTELLALEAVTNKEIELNRLYAQAQRASQNTEFATLEGLSFREQMRALKPTTSLKKRMQEYNR